MTSMTVTRVDTALSRLPSPAGRWLRRLLRWIVLRPFEWLAWLTPIVAYVVIRKGTHHVSLEKLAVVLVAALFVVVLSRYPGPVLVALLWFLPLQYCGLSWLYHLGVPGSVVRQMGAIKGFLGVTLLLAAGRELVTKRRRLDAVDKVVVGFVVLLLAYLFFPSLVSTPRIHLSFSDRLFGFRSDAGYLLIFLAARHIPLSERWRQRALRAVLTVGMVLGGFALYNFLAPHGFNQFLINTIGFPDYAAQVFGSTGNDIAIGLRWATLNPVRVGSLFIDPFTFADFALVICAIALDHSSRSRTMIPRLAIVALAAVSVLVTQTRSDVLALGVIVLLSIAPSPGRTAWNRLRLTAIVVLAVLAFLPSVAGTRLNGNAATAKSNQGHVQEISGGLYGMSKWPLGLGLGTAPAAASQSGLTKAGAGYISDNSLIQVGLELGIGMMAYFLVLLGTVLWGLTRAVRAREAAEAKRPRPPTQDPLWHRGFRSWSGGIEASAAARLAIVGLLVAGQFHHVFQNFPVAWTVWAIAGLGMRDVFLHGLRRHPAPRTMPVSSLGSLERTRPTYPELV